MHRVVTYTEKMTVQLWGVTSGIGEFFVIQSFAFYFARSFFSADGKIWPVHDFSSELFERENETRGERGAPKNWSIVYHAYKKLINQIT